MINFCVVTGVEVVVVVTPEREVMAPCAGSPEMIIPLGPMTIGPGLFIVLVIFTGEVRLIVGGCMFI